MRYLIGIDLGTTNTCIAYADLSMAHAPIHNFRIPQLKKAGYIEDESALPSYCYQTSSHEWPSDQLDLPWRTHNNYFVGSFAKDYGARVPTHLISSAKSWLCHSGANRRDKILPFDSADNLQKISPVEASARYLLHIREAWNYIMAKGDVENEFEQQEIFLTVPASFDEIARTLTIEAAKMAGYASVTLLEEPQAAFYSWIAQNEKKGMKQLFPGACILVCDIGGGTTDFSLLEVTETEGKLSFQRLSVGNHLLLGGDNMDSAVAHYIEAKLKAESGFECTPFQWQQIIHQARSAKEALLSEKGPSKFTIIIQGEGSQIIKNTVTTDLSKAEAEKLLLDGFWKVHPWKEAVKLQKGSGFRFLGLPYEEEACIGKHLAHFLSASKNKPDFILFNGGAVKPLSFQNAIIDALKKWFPEKNVKILDSYSLDLAVARGAVYYGKARKGSGIKIGGGAPRSYYFAISSQNSAEAQAITIVPRGAEEGNAFELNQTFWMQPNTPVAFKMLSSNIRLNDQIGDIVPLDPEKMSTLPPIHSLLRFGKGGLNDSSKEKIPVHLVVSLTPIGTLEVWLKSQISDHRWNLEFQLRNEAGQENSLSMLEGSRKDETFDVNYLKEAQKIISQFFNDQLPIKPTQIMDLLEKKMERPRQDWPVSLLRGLWDELLNHAPLRKNSIEKEIRWWNLAGFFLRPGYGYPLDDHRMKELWKIILAEMKNRKSNELLLQNWICYRRVAGGFNKGQQMQLGNELLLNINSQIDTKNKSNLYLYQEKIRLLAAFEYLDLSIKEKLGQLLLQRIKLDNFTSAETWALGRIGARHPVYGSIANVIPRDTCTQWIESLLENLKVPEETLAFIIGQLARKTNTRELNLPETILQKVQIHFENSKYSQRLKTLLFEDGKLNREEQDQIFGDHLPLGLSIN